MKHTILYNRLVKSPTRKPYVIFNNRKVSLKRLDISEIVKVRGKPYSVYFYAVKRKGVPTEWGEKNE